MKCPEVLEGTLAYMSPEQTGRMNRSLDYRTDFYSLGATFYEMITRTRPFDADDEMELVHCQIAREPSRCTGVIRTFRSRCRRSLASSWQRRPRTATRVRRAS